MKRRNYEEVKKYIEERGYKLLSKEYKNANTKLHMECNRGHGCWITFGAFRDPSDKKRGRRCKQCHIDFFPVVL